MTLLEAIKRFPQQFLFEPRIENKEKLKKRDFFVVIGMGGSHLAADVLKVIKPELPLFLHKNYGLPILPDDFLKKSLVIAVSFSGNTEETISAFKEAQRRKIPVAAISTNGKLLKLAQKKFLPYIKLPDLGLQPRFALGLMVRALLALIGEKKLLKESTYLSQTLKPKALEKKGKELAKNLFGFVPIIYSSEKNRAIALNWKIKFNENSKIPAFFNVFPELNHNEMTGLDVKENTKGLSKKFYFIFLKDKQDHPKIKKRMEILKKLLTKKGFNVETINLPGKNLLEKIFSSILLADWASFYLAKEYNIEDTLVPMVEEFKKLTK